ncbi:hypothetical protein CFOL_v3_31384 [Cephalotus follicularis]|uniref:RVT_2 domain-containing protein n=1 Tax=Cephalotus follicularis TaxID=3775 RepID=A0A1Q3D650_CEPFO|nr:hypothetical protein CFOL_v3_31384 [Cephalotus follicularis]
MRKFIFELGVVPTISSPVAIYCDNNGVVAQANEPRSHQRSKHIERRYHLIQEIIGMGDIQLERVSSEENTADPLTKAMGTKALERHRGTMGLGYRSAWEIVRLGDPTSHWMDLCIGPIYVNKQSFSIYVTCANLFILIMAISLVFYHIIEVV